MVGGYKVLEVSGTGAWTRRRRKTAIVGVIHPRMIPIVNKRVVSLTGITTQAVIAAGPCMHPDAKLRHIASLWVAIHDVF
jgi:hypothetical protein